MHLFCAAKFKIERSVFEATVCLKLPGVPAARSPLQCAPTWCAAIPLLSGVMVAICAPQLRGCLLAAWTSGSKAGKRCAGCPRPRHQPAGRRAQSRCTLCAVQQHKEQRRREQDFARADLVRCASPAATTARPSVLSAESGACRAQLLWPAAQHRRGHPGGGAERAAGGAARSWPARQTAGGAGRAAGGAHTLHSACTLQRSAVTKRVGRSCARLQRRPSWSGCSEQKRRRRSLCCSAACARTRLRPARSRYALCPSVLQSSALGLRRHKDQRL